MKKYDHKAIEKKWQDFWNEQEIYKADSFSSLPKKYILDMFPYPSGAGLHVGHPKGYIATDILSRMYRMQGFNVLHPMGWDAFGLPAEQFAIKNKMHPSIAVDQNVATFKEQLSIIGLDYDWSRELKTTDPLYYKWTQWAFLQMFKKGLAFESHEPINWCPSCKTGLANEDLEDGKCERCGSEVEKKPLRQWVIRITDYAERMLADLDKLDKWPDSVKMSQRNWIGKSVGAEITFKLSTGDNIAVFTTRPDTLFGVTYVVLAPESKLVFDLKDSIQNWDEVKNYIEETKKKSPLDRQKGEKTGVSLQGVFVVNPANDEEVPVWIADYVLADYGTGAVMAVPAHDERDFEFARKYKLSIRRVIDDKENKGNIPKQYSSNPIEFFDKISPNDFCFTGYGVLMNSQNFNGLTSEEAKQKITEFVGGTMKTTYKLRDWVFSRQRYWGEPIPLIHVEPKPKLEIEFSGEFRYKLLQEGIKTIEVRALDKEERKSVKVGDILRFKHIEKKESFLVKVKDVMYFKNINEIYDSHSKLFAEVFPGENIKTIDDLYVRYQKVAPDYDKRIDAHGAVAWKVEKISLSHISFPIPESDLPLKLPEVENYEPSDSGESPLADISEWVHVRGFVNDKGEFVVAEKSPNGEEIIEGRRETNTMPQWAGSCWYYLRYIDPKNSEALVDKNLEQYWQPVDVYVGGMEHATRHLIYARFWHKFLFDIGVVNTEEPFTELHAPGLILAEDGRKMSKRWGNVINPDDMVDRFGADAFRLYEAFMGPFDDAIAWNTDGLVGTRRFVERVVRISENLVEQEKEILTRELHKLIKKVTLDIPAFKFNTAVAAMMTFVNLVEKEGGMTQKSFVDFVKILAPFAPHVAEELWYELGNTSSIHKTIWPEFDESKMVEDEVNIAVQINGKIKGSLTVSFDASQDDVWQKIEENESIARHITSEPKKIIFVPNKLISIVI